MDDHLCDYRQFLNKFGGSWMDGYKLLRCYAYNLSFDELLGEVMVSSINFLNNTNCPRGLIVPLTKIVVEEFFNEVKAQSKLELVNTPFNLINKTLEIISTVCLSYREDDKLMNLPGPVQETLFSTHSTKHTRRQMEDRLLCLPRFNSIHNIPSNSETGFYGIFDGHGGVNAACYVVSHLHQFLAESEHYPEDPVKALRCAYEKTESRCNSKDENSGTTALVILHQPAERKLIVSWVGDSLAMLVTKDSYVMLVDPHKPERVDERKRIQDMGGFVVKALNVYRVNGGLSVSRAIGDKKLKPYVSADPEIRVLDLTGSEHFIVMGCDGLWDVVEPQQVIETVYFEVQKNEGQIDTVARRLVDLAKENNSTDNISVIVIFLTDPIEICRQSVDVNGHRPKILLQDGVIMESNFQNEKSSLNDPGMNGIYGANGNHFGDHMKNESDEDFGPETDVDAIDDILTSPKNLNHFANEGWQKTQVEGNADKLIEFTRSDNADVGDENTKFSNDFPESLNNRDDTHTEQELNREMRSDMFSVDNSNPFESQSKNSMSDLLDFPNNGRDDNNKYVEEVNLQKEDMDNFMNSNLMEQPFEMKSETNFEMEESHEININKNPFGFDGSCQMDSKEMFSPTNENAAAVAAAADDDDDFFNSDSKHLLEHDEMMKPVDAAADKMVEESVVASNNDEVERMISLNAESYSSEANPMVTNTSPREEMGDVFKMTEPEADLFKESLAMDNVENPPVLGSVNEASDVERISREYYPTDDDDARREEEPSSELISPSAPTLEGEARDDIVAESGGEVEDSDDEWNYFKVESGERVTVENKSFESVPPTNESSEIEKSSTMNSPLNPDAAEFIPVSTKPINDEYDANTTPVKALPRDLSDIVASSPNWANMENVNVPEESAFLCEIKSRPSNIFDEVETTQKPEEKVSDLKTEEITENSGVNVSISSPVETEKEEEKIGGDSEEPHGIALASDMTSSFIDPSTMSNQDESPEEKFENFVPPKEEPMVAQEITVNEKVPESQGFGDFEVEMTSKEPDLLSPSSFEEGVSSPVSPIPETPESTKVEAPMSPQPEIVTSEVTQTLIPEIQTSQPISPSPVTQTPTSPDNKEPVEVVPAAAELPEKLVETEEKSNKTVSPEIIGAAAAVVAATAATAVAGAAAVKKAEEVKKDVKKAGPKTAPPKTTSRTSTTTKPVLNGTKTATPTKKPAVSTPPAKTAATARTATTSTTSAAPASRTAAPRVSSVSKTAPKPMNSVTSTLNKVPARPKPTSTTSVTSKVSSPSKPTVSSTTTKPATAPVKSTTRVSGVMATSAAPKPKPRVPSAPVDKKSTPLLNGDSKSTVKRTEMASKKPSTTTTTSTTRVSLSARPATAPAKTVTKTTVTTTRTVTAKPRSSVSSTTTTTTTTVTAASKVSASAPRKLVNDKQAKEVANRITSKSTVTKTNGTLPGKTGTTTTTVTKTRKTLSTTTPSKTEKDSKTEIKAEKIVDETVEIIKSENDNSLIVDTNKDINLINSIASN